MGPLFVESHVLTRLGLAQHNLLKDSIDFDFSYINPTYVFYVPAYLRSITSPV